MPTTVVEDSQVATSGRFYAYAFWAQDDFRLRPDLTLNLGLRYDIMKPYTEVYDRWSFLDPALPNSAVGGYPGAIVFAGDGPNSCHCRTPIKTYYGAVGPRLGLAYSMNERLVVRTAYGINYSRRGAVGGRAGARNGTGTLGLSANASFPSANGFDPSYNWNNGVPSYPAAAIPRSDAQRGLRDRPRHGGSVTFGDPEIGGRPPRYQNWNAGVQSRFGADHHRRRELRRQPRGLPRRERTRILREPARPAIPRARQPAHAAGHTRQHRRPPRRSCPASALPYPNFSGTIAQMLRPFPQYSGVTDVYGDVARSTYHSLQLTVEKRRSDDGLTVNFNYTFQPDRGQSRGADRL